MKVFEVGGCVRDQLLGLTPKDFDYVVVGATVVDNTFCIHQLDMGNILLIHPNHCPIQEGVSLQNHYPHSMYQEVE